MTESLPAHPVVEIAPGRGGRIHSAYPALKNNENRAFFNSDVSDLKMLQSRRSQRALNWMIWRDANFISNLCAHSYSNLGFINLTC